MMVEKCHHHRLTPDCPYCAQATVGAKSTLTTLEREVVTAAEDLAKSTTLLVYLERVPYLHGEAARLIEAVRALQSARNPAGVRPSEVAPGTRFKVESADFPPDDEEFVLIHVEEVHDNELRQVPYGLTESHGAFRLKSSYRILPLDPQEPA